VLASLLPVLTNPLGVAIPAQDLIKKGLEQTPTFLTSKIIKDEDKNDQTT
jgi:hypothetical protein